MLRPFGFHRPSTVEEARGLLVELGSDAMLYAGGTELLLAMKAGLLQVPHLIDIKGTGISEIRVDENGGSLHIGAGATHRDVEESDLVRRHVPVLAEMTGQIANVRVRNAGTLGGNICFNEPHADPGAVLSLLDATITIEDDDGTRILGCDEFFVDPFETAAGETAIVTEVVIPPLPERSVSTYMRFGYLERPMIGVGCLMVPTEDGARIEDLRLSVGAVGPRPCRLDGVEQSLRGLDAADLKAAVQGASLAAAEQCEATEDSYGSAAYKQHLARVLVGRALTATAKRMIAGQGGQE